MEANQRMKTIREQVTDEIRAEVMSGRYEPGVALREVELATRFGVSRGPVRDALLQLSQEGLLVYQPNSGMRVGEPPSDETRELIVSLRRQIEVFALERSFDDYTEEDRKVWGELLNDLKVSCEKGDTSGIVMGDAGFHESILASGKHPELMPTWKQLCVGMRFTYTRLADSMEIYDEHKAILDAYDRGDKQEMIRALEANII